MKRYGVGLGVLGIALFAMGGLGCGTPDDPFDGPLVEAGGSGGSVPGTGGAPGTGGTGGTAGVGGGPGGTGGVGTGGTGGVWSGACADPHSEGCTFCLEATIPSCLRSTASACPDDLGGLLLCVHDRGCFRDNGLPDVSCATNRCMAEAEAAMGCMKSCAAVAVCY